MNEEDYSLPVHTSLLQKDEFFGIGQEPFMFIVMMTIIFSALIHIACLFAGGLILFVLRFICRKEQLRLVFIMQTLSEQDYYRG